jgi:hypothetical protein
MLLRATSDERKGRRIRRDNSRVKRKITTVGITRKDKIKQGKFLKQSSSELLVQNKTLRGQR